MYVVISMISARNLVSANWDPFTVLTLKKKKWISLSSVTYIIAALDWILLQRKLTRYILNSQYDFIRQGCWKDNYSTIKS